MFERAMTCCATGHSYRTPSLSKTRNQEVFINHRLAAYYDSVTVNTVIKNAINFKDMTCQTKTKISNFSISYAL